MASQKKWVEAQRIKNEIAIHKEESALLFARLKDAIHSGNRLVAEHYGNKMLTKIDIINALENLL